MPVKRKQKEYFQNARTWKQISTNVPHDMHRALKACVTSEYTMSHLLRDLIFESEIMRGGYPQPKWSVELSKELMELRREIADLRAEQAAGRPSKEPKEAAVLEASTQITEGPSLEDESEWLFLPEVSGEEEDDEWLPQVRTRVFDDEEAPDVVAKEEVSEEPKKTRAFGFLKKLPEKLGFGRKTA